MCLHPLKDSHIVAWMRPVGAELSTVLFPLSGDRLFPLVFLYQLSGELLLSSDLRTVAFSGVCLSIFIDSTIKASYDWRSQ